MTTTGQLQLIAIGQLDRPEFGPARRALVESSSVVRFASIGQCIDELQRGLSPAELIVLAQSWPGEFSPSEVERLQRLAPLSRVLRVLGSWCEGDARTGGPWPATGRVYWHQSATRHEQDSQRLHDGKCPTWGLPVTASDEDRLLLVSGQTPAMATGLIAIQASCFDMAAWLATACRMAGYASVRLPVEGPLPLLDGVTAAIWEGTRCTPAESRQLGHLVELLPMCPIVALLDFPRWEDRGRALSAGASVVLSKPLLVNDLLWELRRLTPACAAA